MQQESGNEKMEEGFFLTGKAQKEKKVNQKVNLCNRRDFLKK